MSKKQLAMVKTQVPEGYKQTEVGVIPVTWNVSNLGKFVLLQRGHDLTHRDRKQGNVPVMGSAGQNGFHDTALVKSPGVVIGRSGASFGQAHYCEQDFWPHNTALYVTDFLDNDRLYAFYFLKSIDFSRHNSGGAQQSLNRNFIAPIPIAIPPLAEQNLIARALSDTDALIESLEQLLAKKRQIKQGAMQELLRSKDTWDKEEIRNILTLIMDYRGRTPKKLGMEWGGGDIRALSAGNVKRGWIDFEAEAYFASEALYQKWMTQGVTKENDILVTTEAPLGNIAIIPDSKKYILSQRVISLRTDPQIINSKYLYHYISSEIFQELLKKDSSGSTATGIQRLKLEKILIAFPSLAEQQAIATILSDMDLEIGAIETKLTKARQRKQGMMHELLTGKIRLIDKGNT